MAEYGVSKNISLEDAFGSSSKETKAILETTKRILKKQLSYDIMKHIEITERRGGFGVILEATVFVFNKKELREFAAKIKRQATDEFIDLMKGLKGDEE